MITPELLSSLEISHQQKGAEFILDCPYCGKAGHLYLNQTGVFKCHHCQEAGGWSKLRKEYGEGAPGIQEPKEKTVTLPTEAYISGCQKKLLGPNGTPVVEYLYSRKITLDQIHKHLLGMDTKEGKPVLVIPIIEDEKPVNIKYRTVPPAERKYFRFQGGKSALFNGDILKGLKPDNPVFITEGEIDCMSLSDLGVNAVGITGGAGTIIPAWIKQLEHFEKIYLVYDSDEPGQKGAREIARRLGMERCFNIVLPDNDVNQWVMKGGTKEAFQTLVQSARLFEIENVCTTETAFRELIKEFDRKRDATALEPHWPSVNRLTGAFESGDLIVVSAKEKTGKTTWCLNLAYHWAKQGHAILFYCLEMRPTRLLRKLIQVALSRSSDELNPHALLNGYGQVSEYPIYWGYNYRKVAAEVVFETVRQAWKRYGVEVVIFDNLHYLARDIAHQAQEVGYISRSFKLLAEELEIPIVLIAQPRKIDRSAIMGIEDLKDSSSIGADADQVIILYREKTKANEGGQSSFKAETLVRVDASRYHPGGETLLHFDGERGVFSEVERRRS